MLTVTKRFEFHFAHYLPEYPGKCAKLHGHTGILEVEVAKQFGKVESTYPGMVMDFKDLKAVVMENVIDKLDHACLNEFFPENPTAENTVLWIRDQLMASFGHGLVRVRIWETPSSYAEWRK